MMQSSTAAKTLKPYQGLKRKKRCHERPRLLQAAKTLKPYQGLKLTYHNVNILLKTAAKTLKPYQGLKRASLH